VHEKQMDKYRLMQDIINLALMEDCVQDDITTNSLLNYDNKVIAKVTAKEEGIISGIEPFITTMKTVDSEISIKVLKGDGDRVKQGDLVMEIQGLESSILKSERTALNFIQRLSGIATFTNKFVEHLKPFHTTLLDTRKTTPGMRYLEKDAVKHGGGSNHRLNLEDMAMIKDNHIEMAGSITTAVKAVRKNFPEKKIEVEVKNHTELVEVLELEVDMIMLDNFSLNMLKEAVQTLKDWQKSSRPKLEISGNVSLDNIQEKAAVGVDFISVGALTHSFKSLDLSLNISRTP